MSNNKINLNFINKWRQGQLSASATASTVALSIILIATLCSAQYAIKKPIAKGNNIYTTIAKNGLSKYIDQTDSTQYYFEKLNINSNTNNGAILHRKTSRGANGLEHRLTNISFYSGHIVIDELTIDEHLGFYDAKIYSIITESDEVIQNLHHTMHNNAFRTATKGEDISESKPIHLEEHMHYLLLDLFTSIGISTFNNKSFTLNFIDQIGFPQSKYIYKTNATSITETHTTIMTTYHQFGKPEMKQDLIFDTAHNLVAQNDYVYSNDPRKPDAFRIRVDLKAFLAAYPNALLFLERWIDQEMN